MIEKIKHIPRRVVST